MGKDKVSKKRNYRRQSYDIRIKRLYYINTFLISNDGNIFTLVHSGYQKMKIYKTIGINFLLLSLAPILQSDYASSIIHIDTK
jgi:hypothetical protein